MKKLFVLAVFSVFLLLSCSALEEPVSSLDDGISKMQTLPVGSVVKTERVLSNTEPEYLSAVASIDSSMGTNFKIVEISEARVFDEGYTLGFNNSAIWLGSILDARSLAESKFDEIVFDRAPYTFSISLKGNGQQVMGTVNGTRSAYEQKLSDLLSPDITKAQAGTAEFSLEDIYSKDDLMFKIGYGVGLDTENIAAKISGLFDFSNKKIKSRILVKYTQVYYSSSIDKPSKPSRLFANGLQFSEFQSKIDGNVSPVYISSIKYGRMGYLSIESEENETTVKTAINNSLKIFAFSAGGELTAEVTNVFKNSKMRVVMIGGDVDTMSNISSGLDGFNRWVQNGSTKNNISAGMPIAFELSYLKNNRTAEVYKMNKQYAVVWYDAKAETNTNGNNNTNISDNIICDVRIDVNYTVTFPTVYDSVTISKSITYIDSEGNESCTNPIVINKNDNNGIIIFKYEINGEDMAVGGASWERIPWKKSGQYIVYTGEIINNPYKYISHPVGENGVLSISW